MHKLGKLTESRVSERVHELANLAGALASRPLNEMQTGRFDGDKWKKEIDCWLLNTRELPTREQAHVIAHLRMFSEPDERGMHPLREAALAQLQTQQAEQLSRAANRLSTVGIWVAIAAALATIAQVGLAVGSL